MHGVHASGGSSPLLSAAIVTSAEGIMGFWDGTASLSPGRGAGNWTDFFRLEPNARLNVLRHDLAPLLTASHSGADLLVTTPQVGAAFGQLLTLTPPTVPDLVAQLPHLRTAADLRADRLSEIMAQQSDMLSFYGAQFSLHPERKKWSLLLLTALYEMVIVPEMRLKLFASMPRPIDFSPQVQPIIATPSHSSYPSGHATEAFAFATVLALLSLASRNAGPVEPLLDIVLQRLNGGMSATTAELLPFRLAARIADNRTVAGVHFPVDSAHGALLGLSAGLAFVAACQSAPTAVPTFSATGVGDESVGGWSLYFSLDTWRKRLVATDWLTGSVQIPGCAPLDILAKLWENAVYEWQ